MSCTIKTKTSTTLPFSEDEILNILKVVDAALADEKIEAEVRKLFCNFYNHISFEELEDLHKKVNIYLQKNK